MLRSVLAVCAAVSFVYADSPVFVSIETDNTKSLNLGTYDRKRFDLLETFHPLPTAAIAKADQVADIRQRVQGVKSVDGSNQLAVQPQDASVEVPLPTPQRVVFGEWSEWTAWTGCVNGERERMRTCVTKRPALRVVCHGPTTEVQKCYSSAEHHVPVAEDPWTIEREISEVTHFKA